jgi:hypothetical protein
MALICVGLHFLLHYVFDTVLQHRRDEAQEKIIARV